MKILNSERYKNLLTVPELISYKTWSHPPDFVILLPDIIISLENNTQFMNYERPDNMSSINFI